MKLALRASLSVCQISWQAVQHTSINHKRAEHQVCKKQLSLYQNNENHFS